LRGQPRPRQGRDGRQRAPPGLHFHVGRGRAQPTLRSPLAPLRRGKFAVVKKCVEKATGREFAAKFLRKRRKGEDCRADILHEIAVLELAARSPHVVDLHEVYETPAEIVLVLECAAGGEIFQQCVAEPDEAFTEQDVIRLVRQILRGVAHLHQNNVVHLDLKPQNILLTSSSPLGDIRIVDFGLSRRVDAGREVREILGTPEYPGPGPLGSPLALTPGALPRSVGVLTYVMLTGESPFLGDTKQETFLNISQVNVQFPPDVFQGVSDQAIGFIRSLLLRNPRYPPLPPGLGHVAPGPEPPRCGGRQSLPGGSGWVTAGEGSPPLSVMGEGSTRYQLDQAAAAGRARARGKALGVTPRAPQFKLQNRNLQQLPPEPGAQGPAGQRLRHL
uniref:non-specific serine/threonine protein kinase n=1 Tax=Chelydra serpentina TaxID=8475 RepID=A0A8C3SMA1_CHESE